MRTALFVFALCASAACAADAPAPPSDADVKAANSQIAGSTPGTVGVFAVQDNGDIRHVQSGLVCPAKFPNVRLWHLLLFPNSGGQGLDVGCDYGRPDTKGGASSKLTIYATKMPDGFTADDAFAKYRAEIEQVWPDAVSLGPALELDAKSDAPTAFPPIHSEEFRIRLNDADYTTQLYATVQGGWAVEVRTTFVGAPNTITITKEGGEQGGIAAAGDRLMGPKALFVALGTIGH